MTKRRQRHGIFLQVDEFLHFQNQYRTMHVIQTVTIPFLRNYDKMIFIINNKTEIKIKQKVT